MNLVKKLPRRIFFKTFLLLTIGFSISPVCVHATTILQTFVEGAEDVTGYYPKGGLLLSGGILYGVNTRGGDDDYGTIFSINPDGTNYTVLHEFDGADGGRPFGSLIISGGKLFGVTELSDQGLYDGTIYSINTDGTGYQVLHRFEVSAEEYPGSSLALSGSVLYGVISYGGTIDDNGSLYSINTDGTGYTVRHNFDGDNGATPRSVPIIVENKLYGTTEGGGEDDLGTIYSINTDGTGHTVLHEFNGEDGQYAAHPLIFSNGKLYGIITNSDSTSILFSLNTDGTEFDILYELNAQEIFETYSTLYSHGATFSNLILSGNKFYFSAAGAYGSSAILSSDMDGSNMFVLSTFADIVGGPNGALIVEGGVMYGVTVTGSSVNLGTIFSFDLTDEALPWIAELSPGDDDTLVDVDSRLLLTFNEYVEWAGVNNSVTVYRTLDDSVFFAQSGGGGSGTEVLSVAFPRDFEPETEYYVVIGEDSVTDISGNAFAGITGSTTWSFTTGLAPAVEEATQTQTTGRTNDSRRTYGCKDVTAQNYNYFSSHRQSLCVYGTAALTGVAPLPTTPSARDLDTGMTGGDVLMLQKLLNANGYVLASAGPGSAGNETTTFGSLTRAALARYQAEQGIAPAVGYFGPITRAQMKMSGFTGVWW